MRPPTACYHCGEPVPSGVAIYADLKGVQQPMCCVGCKAVAEFISHSGLASFYDFRNQPEAGLDLTPEPAEWARFDTPDLIGRYVHETGEHAETTVDIGGMYCSACVWLLDNALRQTSGIESVAVNPATRRAVVRWQPAQLPFSQLLAAIARVGFRPAPVAMGGAVTEADEEYRRGLKRLVVAATAGMQVMMFAVALYAGEFFGIEGNIESFLRIISLLVSLPIVFYSARPFFAAAWRGIRARSPGMDLPVSIAIAAAFVASVYATLLGQGAVYFDSVAMFVFFLSATRFLEMRARHRSDDYALALAQLLPDSATRLREGVAERIALDQLRGQDLIRIRPGDVIPADGEVASGTLAIDEALLTGESLPVERATGSSVFAGGVVRSGNATVRVVRTGASTSLAEIGRLLERAKSSRPPIALLADRIASRFVLSVLLLAAASGALWLYVDSTRAFEIALATLVVTCPCALSLATPAALAAATSRLARNGFLLVNSRILEVLGGKAAIVFDKTGTLTEGRPAILETTVPGPDRMSANAGLGIAASIEAASEHVLARAFAEHVPPDALEPQEIKTVPGAGVEAVVAGRRYRIGSARFVSGLSGSEPPAQADAGQRTLVFLGDEHGALLRFEIGDKVRADAREAIQRLKESGFRPVIASGDRPGPVRHVAEMLNIDEWHARLSPADKLALIARMQSSPERVIMVGDGINDAPVLAAADASVALDAGTALARASADAVSLGKKLGTIAIAADVARATRRIIRQNLTWAVIYNLTAVPLAVSGYLAPWMAAIGMSGSSLLVVLNALRLHRFREPARMTPAPAAAPHIAQGAAG